MIDNKWLSMLYFPVSYCRLTSRLKSNRDYPTLLIDLNIGEIHSDRNTHFTLPISFMEVLLKVSILQHDPWDSKIFEISKNTPVKKKEFCYTLDLL